ncbi:P-loop containing nucleoside triphosphate hydrolase protein [Limtongia smithiae]|uniref:P-loop containing nucleoside triphosphate hydrolase protein n=1 Tax=Limtongia smithiae TaxID=1125753 RepID=UPI0034CD840E
MSAPKRQTTPHQASFTSLGLSKSLVEALAAMAIRRPSKIQTACIPQILQGKDCIGGARTGSGKTMAFAAPILQKFSEDPYGVFALILTPTRELALQISEQFSALGSNMNIKIAVVVGGMDMVAQGLVLQQRPHIVIATPGRLADHIRSGAGAEAISGLQRVRFLVLDEADRLLTPGFGPDLEECMNVVKSPRRQTLLFTATLTSAVMQLKEKSGDKVFAHEVLAASKIAVPDTLVQSYLLLPTQIKEAYLVALLAAPENLTKSAIVFVNRAKTAEILKQILLIYSKSMDEGSILVTSLHAQLSQQERISSLARFRAGAARVLVATDVASRGLDIPIIELVIHYDIPADPDDYIHRAGRTARAGHSGESVAFVTEHDVERIQAIEARVCKEMDKYTKIDENTIIREFMHPVSSAKREAIMDLERDLNKQSGHASKARRMKLRKTR